MSAARRSPLSPKALTLGEVKRLPRGTRVIYFSSASHQKEEMAYLGWHDSPAGAKVILSGFGSHLQAADAGLEPYSRGLPGVNKGDFNPTNCLVLPQDSGTLPNL